MLDEDCFIRCLSRVKELIGLLLTTSLRISTAVFSLQHPMKGNDYMILSVDPVLSIKNVSIEVVVSVQQGGNGGEVLASYAFISFLLSQSFKRI